MSTVEGPLRFGRPFDQVGIVVPDLDEAVHGYAQLLGLDDWLGWTYDRGFLGWQELDGCPNSWGIRLAVAGARPQIELIQPLDGQTVHRRWLDRHGPGVQHVAYFVHSFHDAREELNRNGCPMVQGGGGHGLDGDGAFGYFDTTAMLGVWLEIIEPPARRAAAHFTLVAREGT